jgi:glycosyltransferase involved in cell wall biosynthesis
VSAGHPRLFRRRRRLRVGVPAQLAQFSPRSGHGRVWRRVLDGLADRVVLEPVDSQPISSAGVEPDVWLADGHGGAVHVEEPVVAAVHEVGWTTPELRGFLEPGFAGRLAAQTAAGVASAAHVLTPSQWARGQVLDAYGVSPARVHTVPYGVDPAVFRPGLSGGRSRVAGLAAIENPPYILCVASVTPRKNIPAVRHAVARLARRGFDHVLALVPADAVDRNDSDELRRAAEAELPAAPGRIVSLAGGDDTELAALMAGAAAVCMPSFSEGFGLPALEAMACGALVIVSDRGALPEVVGGAGVIVPPTAEALEEALVQVFTDVELAARLRQTARERAQTFTWERMVEGWLAVLELAAAEAL